MGYRYRLHSDKLPGKPDIVFPSKKMAIFVHGCFWHGHSNCVDGHIPKTNSDFWKIKIDRNKERDVINIEKIQALHWEVLVIWECELESKKHQSWLIEKIFSFLINRKY